MYRRSLFSLAVLLATFASAQTVPTLTKALPTGGTLVSLGTSASIDLRNYFGLAGVTGQIVQFDTVLGKFNVEMLPNAAPQNVANFLNYVQSSSFTDTFLHRSVNIGGGGGRIVQGGGFRWSGTAQFPVETFNPVPLEYNLPNSRGTIAAARTSDLNSATSQWYFNVGDNSTALGPSNGGGYTVFGRVIGSGMGVVDAFGALPTVNAGGAFAELPVRNYTSGNVTTANLALINSVSVVPTFPAGDGGASVVTFSGTNTTASAVDATIAGSTLLLTPLAPGSATITVRATDTNGSFAEGTLTITALTTLSRSVAVGQQASFFATTAGATAYQWQRNGVDLAGNTGEGVGFTNVQPFTAGLVSARVTTPSGVGTTRYAILGITSNTKLVGAGTEFPDIFHGGTGFTYDQILLEGSAASVTADAGQILRMSYVDLSDDIVQVEFSGPGTLTLVLENSTGPALPVNYNQNVSYMKGRGNIILTGATVDTHLSVFSVGRANAVNQALFKDNVTYDGWADIGFIAIMATDGRFGGLRAANARFSASAGLTGVYAPDVTFTGPVFVGDIDATGTATPYLSLGSGSDVRITGGDLRQTNNRAVAVSGITQLKFTAGSTSHGTLIPVQLNQGRLEQNGTDITTQIVTYP